MGKFFSEIDDSLTRFVGKLSWLSEVHWNKDNIWWAHQLFIYAYTLLSVLGLHMNKPLTIITGGNILLEFAVFSFGAFVIWEIFEHLTDVISNTRSSPNPNRHHPTIKFFKVIGWYFLLYCLFYKHGGEKILRVVGEVINLLALYLLCIDPMPPEEKQKRLKKKEMKRSWLVSDF
jgi:hypothetical protein